MRAHSYQTLQRRILVLTAEYGGVYLVRELVSVVRRRNRFLWVDSDKIIGAHVWSYAAHKLPVMVKFPLDDGCMRLVQPKQLKSFFF